MNPYSSKPYTLEQSHKIKLLQDVLDAAVKSQGKEVNFAKGEEMFVTLSAINDTNGYLHIYPYVNGVRQLSNSKQIPLSVDALLGVVAFGELMIISPPEVVDYAWMDVLMS
jgi:hypothetical protein